MTDLHLENAIKYCESGKGKWQDVEFLKEEKLKRSLNKLARKCQFCKSMMNVCKIPNRDEDDWDMFDYRLMCECGASGPKININKYQ